MDDNTASVVVRDESLIYNSSISLVLHQSPLDLTRLAPMPNTAQSVLLSQQGQVITTSDSNIGFRTAFYTLKDSTEHFDGATRSGTGLPRTSGEEFREEDFRI